MPPQGRGPERKAFRRARTAARRARKTARGQTVREGGPKMERGSERKAFRRERAGRPAISSLPRVPTRPRRGPAGDRPTQQPKGQPFGKVQVGRAGPVGDGGGSTWDAPRAQPRPPRPMPYEMPPDVDVPPPQFIPPPEGQIMDLLAPQITPTGPLPIEQAGGDFDPNFSAALPVAQAPLYDTGPFDTRLPPVGQEPPKPMPYGNDMYAPDMDFSASGPPTLGGFSAGGPPTLGGQIPGNILRAAIMQRLQQGGFGAGRGGGFAGR